MRYLIVLMAVLLSGPAYADPCTAQDYTDAKQKPNFDCPSPGESDLVYPKARPTQASKALKKGEAAPASGILMDRARVDRLYSRITALRRLRYQDIQHAAERKKLDLNLVIGQHGAAKKLLTFQRDDYKQQLSTAKADLISANKWYRSGTFGYVMGVVTSALLAGAAAIAVSSAK